MYEYNLDYIKEITGISAEEAKSLAKYLSKLPVKVLIETYKMQTDYARQNRDKLKKEYMPEYYFAMHLLALKAMKRTESASAIKQELTQHEAERLHKIRTERIKAGRGKKESKKALLVKEKYFDEIKKLYFEDSLSWREISEYLAKYHKVKISHGYIQQKFHEAAMYAEQK
ncbi:hypothetical protein [Seleniivibrio woodruffii]|uniref:hypothetical protein n=1 Tax=Seleniivibrio woodruffii TaxID=1078050 RepID=UPI0024092F01|nr:hypothetical protein [Seleniivibrio woodruffii]